MSECLVDKNKIWSERFFSDAGYDRYLKKEDFDHNCRIRPDDQDIFDWLLERKEVLNIGAEGMTMKETFEILK